MSGWESRASTSSGIGTPSPSVSVRRVSNFASSTSTTADEEVNNRQWTYHAFEWVVRDVHRLRDHVENGTDISQDANDGVEFEVLKESHLLGDGKFRLGIAKSSTSEHSDPSSPQRTQPTTLSLYVTSVMLEYAHTDYEIYTSMFAGIKCQDDRAGERGARPEWVWEFWQNEWTFREDSEVWECTLPSLSALLDNRRIAETDSFVVCMQIHSPIGPFFPQQPSAAYVPKELLDGLEALLDNANTGDVQFVCLERGEDTLSLDSVPNTPDTETPHRRRSSSSSSVSTSASPKVARKRIIYAHSDILTRRSEYFATMLNSAFSENAPANAPGDRKIYTIMVEEADFVTIYWLLKWVYANWLLFKEHDNPKIAIEGVGAGWSARSLRSSDSADEWAWKTFSKSGLDTMPDGLGFSDTRSVASGDSASNVASSSKASASQSRGGPPRTTPRSPSTSKAAPPPRPPPSPTRRTTGPPSTSNSASTLSVPMSGSASVSSRAGKSSTMPPPLSTSVATGAFPPTPHYPISPPLPRSRGKGSNISAADPHPHPTPPPPPASALSMYQVAHRYGMPGLATLSLEHMMSTITPQSSFALLLASSTWDDLHVLVEDYVVDKWDEVSVSAEFEQCCQEVAAGE
ncbi:hypothetical protein EIP86_009579 [Pleurotus ostreatoroseus]|nr:hypothetical protein EIP86_009579 [Pleurotus ostreatoroseus]